MKAVYFPEKLAWAEKTTESASGVDIVLKATTPMNTYVIALVMDGKKLPSPKLKCSSNIGGEFSWQTFPSVEEAKLTAQRHYESTLGNALERNAEFLIDVSEVVLIKPDETHSNFAVRRGVNASVYRRENEPDRWRLMAGNCFFYKPAGRFVLDISVDFDKELDDVTFSSYQEAVNACESWAKVNL